MRKLLGVSTLMFLACGGPSPAQTTGTTTKALAANVLANASGKAQKLEVKFATAESIDPATEKTYTIADADLTLVLPPIIAVIAVPTLEETLTLAVSATQQAGGTAALTLSGKATTARQSTCGVGFVGNVGTADAGCVADLFGSEKLLGSPTGLTVTMSMTGASLLEFDASLITNTATGETAIAWGTIGSVAKLEAPADPTVKNPTIGELSGAGLSGTIKAVVSNRITDLTLTAVLVLDFDRDGLIDSDEVFSADFPASHELAATALAGAASSKIALALKDAALPYVFAVVGTSTSGIPRGEGADITANMSLAVNAAIGAAK